MTCYRIKLQWFLVVDGIEHAKQTEEIVEVSSFDQCEQLAGEAGELLRRYRLLQSLNAPHATS